MKELWKFCLDGSTRVIALGLVAVVCFFSSNARTYADTIYVADVGPRGIIKFDGSTNGTLFAGPGAPLDSPVSLALNGSYLYAANFQNNTIARYNTNGVGSVWADASSGLSAPEGLAFDRNGNLYVGNTGNNTIEKFDSSGHGSVFAGPSPDLSGAVALAFDSSGNLYVAEWGANAIEKYDTSGNGSLFSSAVSRPSGLAFDGAGNLCATSWNNGTVLKLNSSGQGSIFGSGLMFPDRIAFDSKGDLYVADQGFNDVVRFDSSGNRSIFASGLGEPEGIAIQVPEPSTWVMVAMGIGAVFVGCRLIFLRPSSIGVHR
jgi:tripartite motif-containing protein 71